MTADGDFQGGFFFFKVEQQQAMLSLIGRMTHMSYAFIS